MIAVANPALEKLLSTFADELVFAQVLIRRTSGGFELRHGEDRDVPAAQLRAVQVAELRALAQKTAAGAFRPLKSAPNLQTGWQVTASTPTELELALSHLYPGAVADWLVAQAEPPPVTDYRAFTERQTGMYRITTKLSDSEVAQVISACCAKESCLKRRLWTVPGVETDPRQAKSIIPCLEPCAVLLESARTAARSKH
jgi:hypothetical protein